jgi:TRAP-type C4-dicarboxylate transport system permease small subunit
MTGYMGSVHITQEFLFGGAILMETAIVMVLLSRVLSYKANRWANIIAGALHTVVVFASIVGTPPAPYYLFHGVIEIACTAFIVWYAWKWVNPQVQP